MDTGSRFITLLSKDEIDTRQSGAVLIFFIGSLVTILMVLAVAVALFQRNAVRSYAARVADAAALAAVSALTLEKGCDAPECTAKERWDYAQLLARSAVSATSPNSGFLPISSEDLEFLPEPVAYPPETTPVPPPTFRPVGAPALTLTVERGRWEPTRSGQSPLFVSLEDRSAAKAAYPGLPRFLGFNAVKVTVKIEGVVIPAPFDKILGRSVGFSAERSAVAFAGREEFVPTAPFAIPVCNLVQRSDDPSLADDAAREDASADYNPYDVCYADRIMGPTSRYCSGTEPDCRGVVPQFGWDPTIFGLDSGPSGRYARRGASDYWAATDWKTDPANGVGAQPPTGSNPLFPAEEFCFWGSQRYPEPEDNFGVVGMPCNPTAPAAIQETDLQTMIDNFDASGATVSRIGNSFCAFESGLTLPSSKEKLARRITAPRSDTNPYNAPISSLAENTLVYVEGGGIIPPLNINTAFITTNISSNCSSLNVAPSSQPNVSSPPRPRWPRAFSRFGPTANPEAIPASVTSVEGGTCNSWRVGWGFWTDIHQRRASAFAVDPSTARPWYNYWFPPGIHPDTPLVNSGVLPSPAKDKHVYNGQVDTLPVWNPWVAIIADTSTNATPCNGVDRTSPTASNRDPKLFGNTPYTIIGYMQLHVYDLDIGDAPPGLPPFANNVPPFRTVDQFRYRYRANPPPPTPLAPPSVQQYRWWFQRPDKPSDQPNCNLVRTRLSCRQPPLPVVGGGNTIVHPRLVAEFPRL